LREIRDALATSMPAVDVLAVELQGPDRFCVFVDHPEGVDHALCGDVTKALTAYLVDFTVDVSSPGIQRPLRTSEQFGAAVGQRVAIKLGHPSNGRRKFKGRIACAGSSHVVLELSDGEAEIAYAEISRANLIDEGRST
jgi:ribosome maturation factor RimP